MSDGFVAAPEQHLLGMILSGGDCRAALSMVDERHFVEPAHRIIFSLAKLAHERFSSTNLPVVAKLIEPQDANAFLSQTGIPITEYMATIAGQTVYGVGNAAQAARNVISQWGRLRIATSAEGIALAAREPSADPVEMARALGITMDEVLAEVRVGGEARHGRPSLRPRVTLWRPRAPRAPVVALLVSVQVWPTMTGSPAGFRSAT